MRRSCNARNRTLATDNDSPNTSPAPTGQPMAHASAIPSNVATVIWAMAPGMAIVRTDNRSDNEKCSPTPNISRMTPISAS
jgi:hypothetical protein